MYMYMYECIHNICMYIHIQAQLSIHTGRAHSKAGRNWLLIKTHLCK